MYRIKIGGPDDPETISKFGDARTKGWKIFEVKLQRGGIVFKNHRPNAFIGTDLEMILRILGMKTLVLAGVASRSGVKGTERHAVCIGYHAVVLRDCVGFRDKRLHDASLKNIERMFDAIDSKELIRENREPIRGAVSPRWKNSH